MAKYVLWLVLLVSARGVAQDVEETTTERRVGVETAVTLSATAIAIGGGFGAGAATLHSCSENALLFLYGGCSYRATSVTAGVTFGLLPIALTLGSYLPHRGLDGKGRWYAALAGAAVGIGGGLGIVSIPASTKDDGAPLVIGAVAGALFAASMPILALELSHGRQRRREERARPQRMAPIATALPGGGWVGIAGTL